MRTTHRRGFYCAGQMKSPRRSGRGLMNSEFSGGSGSTTAGEQAEAEKRDAGRLRDETYVDRIADD